MFFLFIYFNVPDDTDFGGHFYHPFFKSKIQVLWDVIACQLPLTTSQGFISPEDLNFMSAFSENPKFYSCINNSISLLWNFCSYSIINKFVSLGTEYIFCQVIFLMVGNDRLFCLCSAFTSLECDSETAECAASSCKLASSKIPKWDHCQLHGISDTTYSAYL